ncbi:hypothetical protein [Nocardioides panacisoli]|uniref:DUF4190 domain-containing protein n=1 Tax=Nocardioides panacisoli TaxID=627624 RepID=A0ABP7IBV8_9ACTN
MSDQQPPYGDQTPPYPPYSQPWGRPAGEGQPYGTPPNPAYGYGYGYGTAHGGATTSLVVGIISIAASVLGACLCLFVGALGVVIGPVGIALAVKARKEIDAAPQLYTNRANAVGGLVCSIIGTVLGALVLVGSILVLVFYGFVFSTVGGY